MDEIAAYAAANTMLTENLDSVVSELAKKYELTVPVLLREETRSDIKRVPGKETEVVIYSVPFTGYRSIFQIRTSDDKVNKFPVTENGDHIRVELESIYGAEMGNDWAVEETSATFQMVLTLIERNLQVIKAQFEEYNAAMEGKVREELGRMI